MKRIYPLTLFIICLSVFSVFNVTAFSFQTEIQTSLYTNTAYKWFSILLTVLLAISCIALALFANREIKSKNYTSKLHSSISDHSTMGLCILDKHGRIEYVNDQYVKIMDISIENPKGKHIRNLLRGDALTLTACNSNDVYEAKGNADIQIRGEIKHIFYHHFTFFNERNEIKMINMVDDRTKLKTLNDATKKQMYEIDHYSQSKDNFIANVSHEIRTPINTILGMAYYLRKTGPSQEQERLVENIEKASDLLLSTVEDVLDLSRMKSSRFTLYPSDFQLLPMLEELAYLFSTRAEEKGLEWRCSFDFDPDLIIHMDRSRLSRVLTNLLTNALKFTEKGFVSLSVRSTPMLGKKNKLVFFVEDSGIGISEDDICRLFQEFEQLENHLTKQHEGTGLGLAICKKIVTAMNGTIYVDSTPNKGSRFTVDIPCECSADSQISPMETTEFSSTFFDDNKPPRVLVVEDVEINAQVTMQLLEDKGIVTEWAKDGQNAVDNCRKHGKNYYDLILMDIHMPHMDGFTASTTIKNEKEKLADCPILALTATEIDEDKKDKYRGIIDDFLLKPFNVKHFYSVISNYLMKEDPFPERDEAIEKLGGLPAFYEKYLEKFKTNYKDIANQLEEQLQKGETEEAFRIVHSIKGLAATLGMSYLSESAANLERLLQDKEYKSLDHEKLSLALQSFRKRLKSVCGE